MRGLRFAFLSCATLPWLFGCGSDGAIESEDYGNLLASPSGLIVEAEEHPTGWMRADCYSCHEFRNMHTINRTDLPDCGGEVTEACIDLPEIRAIISSGGEDSCVACHGDNGAEP